MNLRDLAAGGAALLVGLAALALTLPFPELPEGHPGPALFPRLVATLLALFGGLLVLEASRRPAAAEPALPWLGAPGLLNAALVAGAVIAYMLLVERLGFPLTAGALNVVLMRRLGAGWPVALLAAATLALGVYGLFARVLLVPLPFAPDFG